MSESKTFKKKLTDTGGSVCVLTFIALCLSAAGTLTEYIGAAIYNNFYSSYVDRIFAADLRQFVELYEKPMIMTVFSLVLFVWAFRGRRKKRAGWEFSAFSICLPIVLALRPVLDVIEIINKGDFSRALQSGTDGDKFRAILKLSIPTLPIFAAFFILIAGLITAGRLIGEDFSAEIPVTKKIAVMPEHTPLNNVSEMSDEEFARPETPDLHPENDNKDTPAIAPVPQPIQDCTETVIPPLNDAAAEESPTVTDKLCPKCGKSLKENAKFCSACGTSLQ